MPVLLRGHVTHAFVSIDAVTSHRPLGLLSK